MAMMGAQAFGDDIIGDDIIGAQAFGDDLFGATAPAGPPVRMSAGPAAVHPALAMQNPALNPYHPANFRRGGHPAFRGHGGHPGNWGGYGGHPGYAAPGGYGAPDPSLNFNPDALLERLHHKALAEAAAQARVQQSIAAKGYDYKGFEPKRWNKLVIGLTSPVVAAGSQQVVSAQPAVPFRGERLVVASDIAGNFLITQINVGKDSQLVAPGGIPARTFSEQAQAVEMKLDTCAVGQLITLVVQNIGTGNATFYGSLIGVALQR